MPELGTSGSAGGPGPVTAQVYPPYIPLATFAASAAWHVAIARARAEPQFTNAESLC